MPASWQMSCIDAPWKPERTKQRWAAARISDRRSDLARVGLVAAGLVAIGFGAAGLAAVWARGMAG
jgi:hypothetical protein